MLSSLLFAAAILLSVAAQQPGPDLRVRVVAHPSIEASALTRAEVSAIFMKRVRSWPDGSEILPVDQSPRSSAREPFSRSIHGKSVAYVTRYWQRLIFSGRGVPPPEKSSDEAVIEFVRARPGAIGYVRPSSLPAAGVKLIEVTP